MKKKTYKAMKNRLYREHKAWILEKQRRERAEDRIRAAEDEANRYKRKFRSIGSSVETIDPGPGKIKMLKWTIQTEAWGNYIRFDTALIRTGEELKMEQYLKEELTKSIARALLEGDIVQYLVRMPDMFDPLNRHGTFGGKLYVVPWEYMARGNKTIELMQKAEEGDGICTGGN